MGLISLGTRREVEIGGGMGFGDRLVLASHYRSPF